MEQKIQIWHNTRCSKSRDAFQWLETKNMDAEWIDYMKNPISKDELTSVLKKLNISAFDLVRKSENLYIEKFKDQSISNSKWITILRKNPQLIERPIVITGEKAIIARPLENIEQLF